MKQIIIATNNKNKLMEMSQIFSTVGYEVLGLKDVFEEPIDIVEDGETFADNAKIKAETISKMINKIVLADDSGLEIDAMNKQPGVYSARFMGEDTPYIEKNTWLLNHLQNEEHRSCRFVSAIALAIPDHETIVVQATIEGIIHDRIEGDNGFGYDPIFYYPPLKKTMASMTLEEKNMYSHRGKALRAMLSEVTKL